MFKFILLVALLGVVSANVPQPANRFFAQTRTSTVIVLSTTTVPTTVKKTCWTAAAALPQCRRRRGIEEQPEISGLEAPLSDLLKPTQVLPLEATQQVSLEDIVTAVAQKTDNSNTELDSSAEVEIAGFENCLGRSAFGITLLYTVSTTVVITQTSTVTSGSTTYSLATCFPSILASSKC